LILLDRDGVLNQMVINTDHGTIDSPLHPDQVRLVSGAREALAQLKALGFKLAICTNQPSAAKGKTTIANLEAVHLRLLDLLDAKIDSSHICFHRAEDGCSCRKPKPGLLIEALTANSADPSASWMVGDGVTDVQAGRAAGVRTAFIGSKRCDVCSTLTKLDAKPDLHIADLAEFAEQLRK
jgi:D-glycero-D-manno-heptose 1,7-bisphosphate phosphatase